MADTKLVIESMKTMRQAIRTHATVVAPAVYGEEEIDCIAIDATLAAQHTIYDHFGKEGERLGAMLRVIAANRQGANVKQHALGGGEQIIWIGFHNGDKRQFLEPDDAFELLKVLAWGLLEAEEKYGDQTLKTGAVPKE